MPNASTAPTRTRAPCSYRTSPRTNRPTPAAGLASGASSERVEKLVLVEHEIDHDVLDAWILVLAMPHPAELAEAQVHECLLRDATRRLAHVDLPAHVRKGRPGPRIAQHVGDRRVAELRVLRGPTSSEWLAKLCNRAFSTSALFYGGVTALCYPRSDANSRGERGLQQLQMVAIRWAMGTAPRCDHLTRAVEDWWQVPRFPAQEESVQLEQILTGLEAFRRRLRASCERPSPLF